MLEVGVRHVVGMHAYCGYYSWAVCCRPLSRPVHVLGPGTVASAYEPPTIKARLGVCAVEESLNVQICHTHTAVP